MDQLNDLITAANDKIWILVIAVLLAVGVYATVGTRLTQVRHVPEMFRLIKEKPLVMENGQKGLSSFRAFCISAASRVGTGNIAGVSIAISVGGPGAVFWMWVVATVGAATAFVESTLGQLYKVPDKDSYRGGPAYYITLGLGRRWAGVLFAVIITVTYGFVFNAVQSNSIQDSVSNSLGLDGAAVAWGVGIAVAALTAAVIFGGVRRISAVSQVLVPVMAASYVLLGLVVVVLNIAEVPSMFALIIENAFGLQEAVGGGVGAAIMQGVRRGLFSNEAGMGSVPNASSTAAVSHPAKQGLVQSLGVYFDTLLICSMTAFIVLLAVPEYGSRAGASLTQDALSLQFGEWAVHYLAVVIFFLAFTSIIGNYYYGEANIEFLTGSKAALQGFRGLVVLCVLLGAVGSLPLVWNLADLTMATMALINLVALVPLSAVAFKLLRHYLDQRRRGLNPVFHRQDMPELRGVACWDANDPAHQRVAV